MNNEELLTKIKNYEDRILYLEFSLSERKCSYFFAIKVGI